MGPISCFCFEDALWVFCGFLAWRVTELECMIPCYFTSLFELDLLGGSLLEAPAGL